MPSTNSAVAQVLARWIDIRQWADGGSGKQISLYNLFLEVLFFNGAVAQVVRALDSYPPAGGRGLEVG